jgi:hypothetical protein
LLSTCVKASKRKGCCSTINLVVMIKVTRTQFLKEATRAMMDLI